MSLFAKRYVLLNEIGQGGMGIVYRALDRLTGKIIALKQVLTPTHQLVFGSISEYQEERIALAREFQTLASLRHPHIISVLDYGFAVNPHSFSEQTYPYFTMDLLHFPRNILEAGRGLSVEGKIYLLVQMLQALAYLHRRGILHRDLKPHNVMVVDEQVRVLDFGLAVDYEQAKGTVGTLPYMAPEVLQGKGATTATDLYAVGVMAYELLVGYHPFDTRSMAQLVQQVLNTTPNFEPIETIQLSHTRSTDEIPYDSDELKTVILYPNKLGLETEDDDPPPPPIDKRGTQTNIRVAQFVSSGGYLSGVVQRLLAKDPRARYQDAVEVIHDFNRVLDVPVPLETVEIRESFLQAAAFVGRKDALSQLEHAFFNTTNGAGSAWLIGGESGVGKSRLVNELRIRALVEGATVLMGQGVAGGGLPYQLWREPLRRLVLTTDLDPLETSVLKPLVSDIADLLGQEIPDATELQGREAQQRLLDTITAIFKKQTQPVVVILEDLHWAVESLEVLRALLLLAKDHALMLIGTFRDDERPNLPTELPDMQALKLNRLDQSSVAALTQSMLGRAGQQPELVDFLHIQTEGNVFFLVEVVRALAEEAGNLNRIANMDLPESVLTGGVRQIISRRLSRVSGGARQLLQLAALTGRQLQLPVLHYVVHGWPGFDIDAWLNECAHAAILEVQEGLWRFSHDKLREGAVESIDPTERPSCYRQVALAMETVYPDPTLYAAPLTRLWHEAGDTDKEAHYATIAGEQQFQISAYRESIRLFERALALVESQIEADNRLQRANLMRQIGTAHERLNDYPTATHYLEMSLKLARELDNSLAIAQALIGANQVSRMLGQFPQARDYLQEALTIARELDDAKMIATILNDLCVVAWLHGEYEDAKQLGIEALDISRKVNNLALIATTLRSLGNIFAIQKYSDEGKRYLIESIQLFEQIGDRDSYAKATIMLGEIERELGNLDVAKIHYLDSLSTLKSIGTLGPASIALINLAWTELDLNNIEDAKTYLYEGLLNAQSTGTIVYTLRGLKTLARLLQYLNDYQTMVEILVAILTHPAHSPEENTTIEIMLHEARLHLTEKDYENAKQQGAKVDLDIFLQTLLSDSEYFL